MMYFMFQAEEAEREERKKLESKREEERRKEEERLRLEEERQVGLVVFIDGNFEPGLSLSFLLQKSCDQQNSLWLSLLLHTSFIWGWVSFIPFVSIIVILSYFNRRSQLCSASCLAEVKTAPIISTHMQQQAPTHGRVWGKMKPRLLVVVLLLLCATVTHSLVTLFC